MENKEHKIAALEASLATAADTIGDITQPTLELFYQQYPEAKAVFIRHGQEKTQALETSMVDAALYCLMNWFQNPIEIEIILQETVPHHANVLDIAPELFAGLMSAVIDTVASVIPPELRANEVSVLDELRDQLSQLIVAS